MSVVQADFGAAEPGSHARLFRWSTLALVVALLALGAFAAKSWLGEENADARVGTTAVTAEELAAQFGIDVKLIGTTAAGGLIDFRYQVIDPVKADPLIHEIDLVPKLVVEDTGVTLALQTLPHDHGGKDLELGGTYFFLMPNTNNAIRAGSMVTVVIGDYRLEHVVAQG